jgi:hypothetical protein
MNPSPSTRVCACVFVNAPRRSLLSVLLLLLRLLLADNRQAADYPAVSICIFVVNRCACMCVPGCCVLSFLLLLLCLLQTCGEPGRRAVLSSAGVACAAVAALPAGSGAGAAVVAVARKAGVCGGWSQAPAAGRRAPQQD